MVNKITTVIFDMDGVLVNSEPVHQRLEKEMYEELGLKLSYEEQQSFVGMSAMDSWMFVVTKYKLMHKPEELLVRGREKYLRVLLDTDEVKLMDGAMELIERLDNTFHLLLASSATSVTINEVLTKFKLHSKFPLYIGGDMVSASKPNPEIFLKMVTDHVNVGTNSASVPKATAWSEINSQLNVNYADGTQSGWSFALPELQNTNDPLNRDFVREAVMGEWTHFVMTHNAATQEKTIYINGTKWATFKWISSGAEWLFTDLSLKTEADDGSPIMGIDGSLALGFLGSTENTATSWAIYDNYVTNPPEQMKFFKGSLDQFRIFSIPLSDTEVQMLYDNEQ